jgi:Zn-dependent protease
MSHLILSILGVVALLISLSVHEYCHGLVAFIQGDETAKRMGRLTLNPLAHIDPIGTVLVPLVGALTGLPLIGWAKPVPYNPYNLQYGKWGAVAVAFAGPLSNFFLAVLALIGAKVVTDGIGLPLTNLLVIFLVLLVMVNVFLGLFNFIPVHPLDGAKLADALLDAPKYRNVRMFLETRGPTILFLLIIFDFLAPRPILGSLLGSVVGWMFSVAGLTRALFIF